MAETRFRWLEDDVYMCGTCGALVLDEGLETHSDWHDDHGDDPPPPEFTT